MEMSSNNLQNLSHQETNSEGNRGIRELFLTGVTRVKEAFDSQVFFNSRLKALGYIKKHCNATTAMLTMNISKESSFLGPIFKIEFSVLYSAQNGKIYRVENFYRVEMPGKEGMIPSYILKALEENETIQIRFNSDDLSTLYDEREVKVYEEYSFDEIVKLCSKKNVAAIQLVDRVFYTRIVCYSSEREIMGAIHIGSLHCLPKELSNTLYPGGTVEYTL